MIAFIDDHRCVHGVGPICRVLGIAPSTFYAFKAVERDLDLASGRTRQHRQDMAFRLMMSAQAKWRKLDGRNRLPEVISGVEFRDAVRHLKDAV